VILRPLPVDLDALGCAAFGGRREALIDRDAPWLYRISFGPALGLGVPSLGELMGSQEQRRGSLR
jgi:hypothetical protein